MRFVDDKFHRENKKETSRTRLLPRPQSRMRRAETISFEFATEASINIAMTTSG